MKSFLLFFLILFQSLCFLTGCREEAPSSFYLSHATPAAPDTVNKYYGVASVGYIAPGTDSARGHRMIITANLFHNNQYLDSALIVWRPAKTPTAKDTLWAARDVNDDFMTCFVSSPLPDFNRPATKPIDTLRHVVIASRSPYDEEAATAQERAANLWFHLNWRSRGVWTTTPDSVAWFPSQDATDDDSLWVFCSELAFLTTAPRHVEPRQAVTSVSDFQKRLHNAVACDTMAAPPFSLRAYLFYAKSGNLRPQAYPWVGGGLLILVLLGGLTVSLLRHIARRKVQPLSTAVPASETVASSAESNEAALHALPAVRQMRAMAEKGQMASPTDWYDLEDALAGALPGFAERLRAACPFGLNEKEWRLSLLVRLRFAPGEAAVLLACSKQNVSGIRTRLYEKITGEKGQTSDFDQFISAL